MFNNRLFNMLRTIRRFPYRLPVVKKQNLIPTSLGILTTAFCAEEKFANDPYDSCLEHDFLIRQATTVNVNAATQLLTVTLVAVQDTSERLREVLTKEICLIQQAMEWGEGTPPQHWDQLVAVRGSLCDLRHNLRTLFSYMDYAEKLATVAAEISYLSGNHVASDAICERIDHAIRTCKAQNQLNKVLQEESLELQKRAIISSPQLEKKLKNDDSKDKNSNIEKL